jgi:hypothetical protein
MVMIFLVGKILMSGKTSSEPQRDKSSLEYAIQRSDETNQRVVGMLMVFVMMCHGHDGDC